MESSMPPHRRMCASASLPRTSLACASASVVPAAAHPVNRDRTVVRTIRWQDTTLITDEGTALYDSRVICEYLNATGNGKLIPQPGPARWSVLVEQALADGIMDAAVLARYETVLRPEPLRWNDWITGQLEKVTSGLAEISGTPRDSASAWTWARSPLGVRSGISTSVTRRLRGATNAPRRRRGSSDSARGVRWRRLGRRRKGTSRGSTSVDEVYMLRKRRFGESPDPQCHARIRT